MPQQRGFRSCPFSMIHKFMFFNKMQPKFWYNKRELSLEGPPYR